MSIYTRNVIQIDKPILSVLPDFIKRLRVYPGVRTMAKPGGLKVYEGFLQKEEVKEILSHKEFENPENDQKLFRLFGEFGSKETPNPAPWMLSWGKKIKERGVFQQMPNQYRVCDWVGHLSAQFKYHIDNHRHGEHILAISLSKTRLIGFRLRSDNNTIYQVPLGLGDAYLISGTARWSWEHCVLPQGQDKSGGKSFVLSYKRPSKSV